VEKISSFDSLVAHLEEADGSYAKSSLGAYFFKQAFTGSSFETFCNSDPYNFTTLDIVAVSMLSVNIPPSATRWILGEGQTSLNHLLQKIDEKLAIDSPLADLTKGSDAWKLWKSIHSLWGVGETKASKLLAAKRPHLFPIYDQHVAKALHLSSDKYWEPWQQFMRSEGGIKAVSIVKQFANEINQPQVSPLRLLDIVIWMQQHGHRFITQQMVDKGKMIRVNYANPS
jgi:hypothetical protein